MHGLNPPQVTTFLQLIVDVPRQEERKVDAQPGENLAPITAHGPATEDDDALGEVAAFEYGFTRLVLDLTDAVDIRNRWIEFLKMVRRDIGIIRSSGLLVVKQVVASHDWKSASTMVRTAVLVSKCWTPPFWSDWVHAERRGRWFESRVRSLQMTNGPIVHSSLDGSGIRRAG